MKRYRNMLVIAVMTTISLGVFYTKVATSESKLPNFYLSTEKGDAMEVKNLRIIADQNNDVNGGGNNLYITTSGSSYNKNSSIFDELNRDRFESKKLNDLQKDEKNYMRGKNWDNSFYLDNDYVWYAVVRGESAINNLKNNNFKLNIDGLDLYNSDRFTFSIDIPGEEEYSYINVEDVQLVGKELVVITNQNLHRTVNEGHTIDYIDQSERHIYRINVSQKKIVDSNQISLAKVENNIRTEIINVGEADVINANQYSVFNEIKYKDVVQTNGESSTEELSNEIRIYNLKTSKFEAINLSKELLDFTKQSTTIIDENYLYLVSYTNVDSLNNKLTVLKYNLNLKKVEGEPIVITRDKGDTFSFHSVMDGKLYGLTNNMKANRKSNKNSLIIADLSNGKVLYEGDIKVKGKNDNELLKGLQLYGLNRN
jgi:hypothetical protein